MSAADRVIPGPAPDPADARAVVAGAVQTPGAADLMSTVGALVLATRRPEVSG